jgi:uncharacterized membrane protein YhdT
MENFGYQQNVWQLELEQMERAELSSGTQKATNKRQEIKHSLTHFAHSGDEMILNMVLSSNTSSNSSDVLDPVMAKVIAIPEMVNGSGDGQGLLNLLINENVPSSFYSNTLVKALIQYKWEQFAKKELLQTFVVYFVFLASFTVFAMLFRNTDDLYKLENLSAGDVVVLALLFFFYCLFMVIQVLKDKQVDQHEKQVKRRELLGMSSFPSKKKSPLLSSFEQYLRSPSPIP